MSGYEDFLDSPSVDADETELLSPNRHGLFEDLLFYWSMRCPESFDPAGPGLPSLAYYPLKIVAAEWMKYTTIMYRAVKQFEYSTSVTNVREELEKLNKDLRALQKWRRRYMASERKIKAILTMLDAHPPSSDSSSLAEDYNSILATIVDLGRRLESMVPVVTSLVYIIDSRRAIDETANVSRLTVMALVFVPMAFISSLFSMNEKFGPGGRFFWVYVVVALPVTIAVVFVAKPPLEIVRMAYTCIRRPARWTKQARVPAETRTEVQHGV